MKAYAPTPSAKGVGLISPFTKRTGSLGLKCKNCYQFDVGKFILLYINCGCLYFQYVHDFQIGRITYILSPSLILGFTLFSYW